MEQVRQRFRRCDRVRKSRDYRRIAKGRRHTSANFVFLVASSPHVHGVRELDSAGVPQRYRSNCRLGLTVSRRVGNAVERNRVKRRIRQWFRMVKNGFRSPDDSRILELVVIARPGAARLQGPALADELTSLATRAQL